METSQDIVTALKALKPELLARYPVNEISLFGSFVHGDQNAASDVDLLVDFSEEASLFDLVRLALFLEERLHRKVDIVPKESLRTEIRNEVLQEAIVV
jgi:predicted nucleotidyltransferase